ncbi:MAG: histidinol dehydrogenase [Pseudomonadales bacterium]|nr:histidinol dehydrogenase [Pseudomonadales bacterium]NIX06905.1 histidinol dehydrogenase [Pseudomonadales bacterium]
MTDPVLDIARLSTGDADFPERLAALLHWETSFEDEVTRAAADVIQAVRVDGDDALLALTARHDRYECESAAALEIPASELKAAFDGLAAADRDALNLAARRIRDYHAHQLAEDWEYTDGDGNRLGQRVTALERVGIYVPGGQAAYPSTVLMTAVPARVAGVGEIIMTVPTPDGVRTPLVLAAAHASGVDRVFSVGGAQAVAALAYGTPTIPKVDKIVGPGGAYVAAAKRLVFGTVGIDVIAGPSEVLVIADDSAPPEWLALDLFSQAEHDASAQAILVSPDPDVLDAVHEALVSLIGERTRAATIRASLAARGALIHAADLAEAVALANRIAPEHLELAVADPDALLPEVRNAGAIFVGAHSPEVMGDYVAGPSHVLPTFGTARFSSPLGVYDFVKRSSVIRLSPSGSETLARASATLARGEGLEAHARAAEVRVTGLDHNR